LNDEETVMNHLINRRRQLLGLGTALLATACVSTRLDPGTDHPANAKAETAPLPARDNILAATPPATEPETNSMPSHAHDHAAPMAGTYPCPMHPQVVKNAPGKCPICGMTLVKKESATPEGAAH
jgi:hypothetical protein